MPHRLPNYFRRVYVLQHRNKKIAIKQRKSPSKKTFGYCSVVTISFFSLLTYVSQKDILTDLPSANHTYLSVFFLFQATLRFIEIANARRAEDHEDHDAEHNTDPEDQGTVDRATAIRFLLARKFDVARALALHRQHGETRAREGLKGLDARSEPLRSELATGKFTILVRIFIILVFFSTLAISIHCKVQLVFSV